MPDKLFRGDITNSVVELNLLDEESSGGVGTLSYRLGNTINGEILTVSKGDFPSYSFGSNPYYNDTNFKGLVIGTSCTSIANYAFVFCSGLAGGIVIPDSVTSIGDYAFGETNINSLHIGSGVTSIGSGAFYNTNIDTFIIPSNVTNISGFASFGRFDKTPATKVYTNTPASSFKGSTAFYSQTSITHVYTGPLASGYDATWASNQGIAGVTIAPWTNYPNIP